MLEIGHQAPEFHRVDHDGKPVHVGGAQSNVTVLYFYPRDETAGCVAQACAFRDDYDAFVAAGATVIGVSDDDDDSHRAFARHRRLQFSLVSDVDGKLRDMYRVPNWLGVLRNRVTYVIDREGIVRLAFKGQIQATRHIAEALRVVRSLRDAALAG